MAPSTRRGPCSALLSSSMRWLVLGAAASLALVLFSMQVSIQCSAPPPAPAVVVPCPEAVGGDEQTCPPQEQCPTCPPPPAVAAGAGAGAGGEQAAAAAVAPPVVPKECKPMTGDHPAKPLIPEGEERFDFKRAVVPIFYRSISTVGDYEYKLNASMCEFHGASLDGSTCTCGFGWKGPHCEERNWDDYGDKIAQDHLKKNLKKYQTYTKDKCDKGRLSMSGQNTNADLMNQAKKVAEFVKLKDGQTVFEGCMGCGGLFQGLRAVDFNGDKDWKGPWTGKTRDLTVAGADISPEAVAWVNEQYPGHAYWAVDNRRLDFIPNDQFDFSFNTFCLNNVAEFAGRPQEACVAATELMRITKPGGFVWVGLHYEDDCPGLGFNLPRNFFHSCFPGWMGYKVTYFNEKEWYGVDHYCGGKTMKSVFIQKPKAKKYLEMMENHRK